MCAAHQRPRRCTQPAAGGGFRLLWGRGERTSQESCLRPACGADRACDSRQTISPWRVDGRRGRCRASTAVTPGGRSRVLRSTGARFTRLAMPPAMVQHALHDGTFSPGLWPGTPWRLGLGMLALPGLLPHHRCKRKSLTFQLNPHHPPCRCCDRGILPAPSQLRASHAASHPAFDDCGRLRGHRGAWTGASPSRAAAIARFD